MISVIIGVIIAVIIIGIAVYMICNVKHGKSFCGAELPEPINTTENLIKKK